MHDYYVSDEEMKNYFVNCDWVILPYNSASQSGVIIDAYKYSRPVISFEVGAIVEQIIDGKSGCICVAIKAIVKRKKFWSLKLVLAVAFLTILRPYYTVLAIRSSLFLKIIINDSIIKRRIYRKKGKAWREERENGFREQRIILCTRE